MKFIKELEEAYVWEGSASSKITLHTETNMKVFITGHSICEHSGDEDGIENNVNDLVGKSFEEDGKTYLVTNATCKIESGERNYDEDYQVTSTGEVSLLIKGS